MSTEYIHSYQETEQSRLMAQAEFLEPYIHANLKFSPTDSILEIGCGVGAQIKTILKRHKVSKVTGIDIAQEQIVKAKQLLSTEIEKGFVKLHLGSGAQLPFADNSFDAVYIFFVLEHFSDPSSIISEAKRVLKSGGNFYSTEVFNSGIYIYPQKEKLIDYWGKFNLLQSAIGGDPDIGMKLANYFIDAGLVVDEFIPAYAVLDKRMQSIDERNHFLNMWESLFLSGYEMLVEKGIIPEGSDKFVSEEFESLRKNPDTVFMYNARQIHARKDA